MLRIEILPCSFDNYSYLLICEASGEAAVVDPTEAYPVMSRAEKENVRLTTVFCTHHHQDHIGGLKELLEERNDLQIVCHSSDAGRVKQANVHVDHGDEVGFGEQKGRVIHTPGHTRGSICYLFDNHLFVGDTLFGAGCGRLFEGDAEQMYGSLIKRLAVLPDDTLVYFGHEYTRKNLEFAATVEPTNDDIATRLKALEDGGGITPPSTIGLEKKTNPFLRSGSEAIRRTLKQRGKSVPDDEIGVFAIVRGLRNDF